MSGDKCRWFNKNGFAFGTGECVLHRRVCGSGHKVCEQYEEYESRPHGEWKNGVCTHCGAECFEDYYMRDIKTEFCHRCGADMRKEGENE